MEKGSRSHVDGKVIRRVDRAEGLTYGTGAVGSVVDVMLMSQNESNALDRGERASCWRVLGRIGLREVKVTSVPPIQSYSTMYRCDRGDRYSCDLRNCYENQCGAQW